MAMMPRPGPIHPEAGRSRIDARSSGQSSPPPSWPEPPPWSSPASSLPSCPDWPPWSSLPLVVTARTRTARRAGRARLTTVVVVRVLGRLGGLGRLGRLSGFGGLGGLGGLGRLGRTSGFRRGARLRCRRGLEGAGRFVGRCRERSHQRRVGRRRGGNGPVRGKGDATDQEEGGDGDEDASDEATVWTHWVVVSVSLRSP